MDDLKPQITVVSPVYRAEAIVDELVKRLETALDELGVSYEIVLVEDCGPDNSWEKIVQCAKENPRVKGIRLSRNFGQHQAITAGLENASGEHVVVMDCDLQDDPADIATLYHKAQEGFDIVFGAKTDRAHSKQRNFFARLFFACFNKLADNQTADTAEGTFSILSRRAVDAFLRYRDVHRHYLMILRTMGFRTTSVSIKHCERFEGHSSYTFATLVKHAIEGVTSQSTRLLRLSIGIGFFYVVAAALGIAYLVIRHFVSNGPPTPGWASTIVVILFSTGLILMSLGILGVYIGNIFDQVRERPLYLVGDSVNFEEAPL